MTSLQPSGYIAECFRSFHVVVEGTKRNLPVWGFPATSNRRAGDPMLVQHNATTRWVRSGPKQELSYRKQIARQLRTQFVEGIYRSDYAWHWNLGRRSLETETLDRSHTTYYLSSYLTLNIIVTLKCGSTENGTIWKLGYGFLFTFHSNYGRIFSYFADIQHQRMAWPWNMGLGSFKVI